MTNWTPGYIFTDRLMQVCIVKKKIKKFCIAYNLPLSISYTHTPGWIVQIPKQCNLSDFTPNVSHGPLLGSKLQSFDATWPEYSGLSNFFLIKGKKKQQR